MRPLLPILTAAALATVLAPNPPADARVVATMSIAADWGCDGTIESSDRYMLNRDGTVDGVSGVTGSWAMRSGRFLMELNLFVGETYVGRVSRPNARGRMTNTAGRSGCWRGRLH